MLDLWRFGWMAGRPKNEAHPWRTVPSANARQDPSRDIATQCTAGQGNAGTRPWRTEFFWIITICPAILNARSARSSTTTTTSVTARAWTTSHPQTSTSGATKPFWGKGRKSKSRQSANAACNIKNKPHNLSHKRAKASNAKTGLKSKFIWRRTIFLNLCWQTVEKCRVSRNCWKTL